MLWLVTVSLLLFSSHTLCTNPGLKVRVTQKALDYGRQVGVQVLQQRLKALHIPDISGTVHVRMIGRIKYAVMGIRIDNFGLPQSTIGFYAGTGIKLSINNANIRISGKWRVRCHFMKHHGSFVIMVSGLSISEAIGMTRDETGRPAVHSAGCTASIGNIIIKFSGRLRKLYNLLAHLLKGSIRSSLIRQICPKVSGAINGLEEHLRNMKVVSHVDKYAVIDYSLVNPIEITDAFMGLDFKGEFYSVVKREEPPFKPPPVLLPDQTDHMMYLGLSDFFVNSAGFAYYRAGALNMNITDDMIPKHSPIRLNTSTFGAVIHQVEKLYPNMLMLMSFQANQQPVLKVAPNNITIQASGDINTFAILPNSSLAPLFVLGISASVSAQVTISEMKLIGSLKLNRLLLSLKHSDVGSFQVNILQSILNFAVKIVVLPKINERLANGFPLPRVDHLSFVNPLIKVNQDVLVIATDIRYSS
ncbi:bactericidal permeability-increasing protein-like [Stegostoma tigrinum]|uniref:bactericidal permeability-increasing protein-like n=1 Tax=Stegostoma tigrinum TaxID=3053191 RepID=UPI002870377C|nr:bactericidal permeability-increasing protein-like [Stegostoma tigrinum]XP_059508847.1 bactericidal permeability-increasing protein-like [Stegostoma tigrinum]